MIEISNIRSLVKALIMMFVMAGATGAVQANTNTVVNLGTLSTPSSRTFNDSFSAPAIPGLQFKDDYTFTLTANSTFGAIANTVDLAGFQINNLMVLLYSGSGPFVTGTTPLLQVSSTGFGSGGTSGEVAVVNPFVLSAGSYTLELTGKIDGSTGGSYSGSFNISPMMISPVPEPSSAMAIMAGLALFGFGMRRKCGFRKLSAEFI